MNKPIIVTFTGPTCSGKSTILDYIRSVSGNRIQCLISTTTRIPRTGEQEGKDFYFISDKEAAKLKEENMYAEYNEFNGAKYGVTLNEWYSKVKPGNIVFLIIDPNGIDNYSGLIEKSEAIWFKYFVWTDLETRVERYTNRIQSQYSGKAISSNSIKSIIDRIVLASTDEQTWFRRHEWYRILFGKDEVKKNINIIFDDISKKMDEMNLKQHEKIII